MKVISNEFKEALANDRRDYVVTADVVLMDNTQLSFTNDEIMTGGFSWEESVSQDEEFTALGSVIIGSAEIAINNIYNLYTPYNFMNAKVTLKLGMRFVNGSTERLEEFKVGTYTVDETTYNGSAINLALLDNMIQFDRPYSSSNLAYPASLYSIVSDACTKCGVLLDTHDFPYKNFVVENRPDDESTTFREVISWVAQIAGCFAKCDPNGKLEIKWFDQDLLERARTSKLNGGIFDTEVTTGPYRSGNTAYGGSFNPWNTGDVYNSLTFIDEDKINWVDSLYSQNTSIEDVVLTGVTIAVKGEEEDLTYTAGVDGYVIKIEGNRFITESNAQTIVDRLGLQLIGLRFRKVNLTCTDNPAMEVGDIAFITDRRQNAYPTFVTRMNFSVGNPQTVVCGASTPVKNSSVRFSELTKNYVDLRKYLNQEIDDRTAMYNDLEERLESHAGLYSTIEPTQSGDIYYMHDLPTLAESSIVWKMTDEAWGVSTDGGTTWNAGMTVDGDTIVRILSAVGINADWIRTGTLTVGGAANTRGIIEILNASGQRIGRWDNTGVYLGNITSSLTNPNTTIGTNGAISTKSLTAQDYVYVSGNSNSFFKIPTNSSTSYYCQMGSSGFAIRTKPAELNYDCQLDIGTTYDGLKFYQVSRSHVIAGIGLVAQGGSTNAVPTLIAAEYRSGYTPGPSAAIQQGVVVNSIEVKAVVTNSSNITYNPFRLDATSGNISTSGNLSVTGTKSRKVVTSDYGERLLYCYETSSPVFGDIGEGTISADGKCYIAIDNVFAETVTLSQYQVFLQKYGSGDCWVGERTSAYFVVEGTPNLAFGWELKAKQHDFDQYRLEKDIGGFMDIEEQVIDYAQDLQNHINEINRGREVILG